MTEPHGLMYWTGTWTDSVDTGETFPVKGTTSVDPDSVDFQELVDAEGRLQYTGVCTRRFLVQAMLTVDNDVYGSLFSLFITKNDVAVPGSEVKFYPGISAIGVAVATPGEIVVPVQWHVTLAKDEYVGVAIKLNSSSSNPDDPIVGPGTLSAWPLPEDLD